MDVQRRTPTAEEMEKLAITIRFGTDSLEAEELCRQVGKEYDQVSPRELYQILRAALGDPAYRWFWR